MGHRVCAKHPCLPRKLEHEYQSLVAELHVSSRDAQRQKAWFPRQLSNFRNERFLAWLLSGLLPILRSSGIPSDDRQEYVVPIPPPIALEAGSDTIPDVRRHIRPFFLTPDGTRPTPYKPYYDAVSYLATQTAFCFTTAPFVLLTLPSSLLVWSRVYFYAVLGAAAAMAFFASPAKAWLNKKLQMRNKRNMEKEVEGDGRGQPLMGLPSDPEEDVQEAVREIRQEVETRRKRGSVVGMPSGEEMRAAVEYKLGKKL